MEKMSEVDLLRYRLANEKVSRTSAQLELAKAETEVFRLDVSLRYGLSANDNINLDTGVITRGAKV